MISFKINVENGHFVRGKFSPFLFSICNYYNPMTKYKHNPINQLKRKVGLFNTFFLQNNTSKDFSVKGVDFCFKKSRRGE